MTPDALLAAVVLLGLAGAGLAVAGIAAARRRRLASGGAALLGALVLLLAGALCATVAAGLQGYRALTHEALAATVHTRPLGPQRFEARFVFPDGREARYELAGDQVAVEARILKWHPWANLLGLHTAYELDRVSGRYAALADEQTRPRTVHALGRERPVDLFAWRQRLAWLAPLVDAEYGSGTFTRADAGATYEVRVSTTGLLVRRVP